MKKTNSNFKPGDIVSTPKFPGVEHLGIIISETHIAHNSPTKGIVLDSYENFSGNTKIEFKRRPQNPSRTVTRALTLTNRGIEYDLFIRNCEHFVTYCEGETVPNSPQLKFGVTLATIIALFIILD